MTNLTVFRLKFVNRIDPSYDEQKNCNVDIWKNQPNAGARRRCQMCKRLTHLHGREIHFCQRDTVAGLREAHLPAASYCFHSYGKKKGSNAPALQQRSPSLSLPLSLPPSFSHSFSHSHSHSPYSHFFFSFSHSPLFLSLSLSLSLVLSLFRSLTLDFFAEYEDFLFSLPFSVCV